MASKQKSTGPKTQEGKAIVSKNAIKSGVYSTTLVLSGESQAEYEQLKDLFWNDLQPKDLIEETLVNDLVQLTWKRLRLDQFEQSAVLAKLNAPIRADEIAMSPLLSEIGLDVARSLLAMSDEERIDYLEAFQILQSLLGQSTISKNELLGTNRFLQREFDQFQEQIKLDEMNGTKDPNTVIDELNARQYGKNRIEYIESVRLSRFIASTFKAMRAQVDILQRYDLLLKEWQTIRDERYLAMMTSSTLSRAHDDLRRAFYKALQEFRKHRYWKSMNATVDLPSTSS